MIPNLFELAERLGINAVVVPLVIAGLFILLVLLLQSIARLFDDRDS